MRSSCTPGHSSNEGQAPYTPRMGQKTTRFYTVLYLKNAQSAIGGAPSAWREQIIWHPPLRFCLKPNTPPQRSRLGARTRPSASRVPRRNQSLPFPSSRRPLTTQVAAGVSDPRPRRTALLPCARKLRTLAQATTWKPLTHEEENQRTSEAPSSNGRGSRWDAPPGPQAPPPRRLRKCDAGARSMPGR